jgi:hypothetical protein
MLEFFQSLKPLEDEEDHMAATYIHTHIHTYNPKTLSGHEEQGFPFKAPPKKWTSSEKERRRVREEIAYQPCCK